jgi:hypothetical protein
MNRFLGLDMPKYQKKQVMRLNLRRGTKTRISGLRKILHQTRVLGFCSNEGDILDKNQKENPIV